MGQAVKDPPLPPGFVLADEAEPPPPPGFVVQPPSSVLMTPPIPGDVDKLKNLPLGKNQIPTFEPEETPEQQLRRRVQTQNYTNEHVSPIPTLSDAVGVVPDVVVKTLQDKISPLNLNQQEAVGRSIEAMATSPENAAILAGLGLANLTPFGPVIDAAAADYFFATTAKAAADAGIKLRETRERAKAAKTPQEAFVLNKQADLESGEAIANGIFAMLAFYGGAKGSKASIDASKVAQVRASLPEALRGDFDAIQRGVKVDLAKKLNDVLAKLPEDQRATIVETAKAGVDRARLANRFGPEPKAEAAPPAPPPDVATPPLEDPNLAAMRERELTRARTEPPPAAEPPLPPGFVEMPVPDEPTPAPTGQAFKIVPNEDGTFSLSDNSGREIARVPNEATAQRFMEAFEKPEEPPAAPVTEEPPAKQPKPSKARRAEIADEIAALKAQIAAMKGEFEAGEIILDPRQWEKNNVPQKVRQYVDLHLQLGLKVIEDLGLRLADKVADFKAWSAEMLKYSPNFEKELKDRGFSAQQVFDAARLSTMENRANPPAVGLWESLRKDPVGGFSNAVTEAYHWIREHTTQDSTPKLARALGENVKAFVSHATARQSVPYRVLDLLAQVFPDSYKNPAFMKQVMGIMRDDNILGGLADFRRQHSEATRAISVAKQDLAAAMAKKDAAGVHDAHAAIQKWTAAQTRAKNSYDGVVQALAQRGTTVSDLFKDVHAAQSDPKIVEAMDRWKKIVHPVMDDLYNRMKNVDPETQRTGRGLVFKARMNLLALEREADVMSWFMDENKPPSGAAGGQSSSYTRPNVRRDPFDRSASFTHEYSANPEAILANMLGARLPETSKLAAYEALQDAGIGVVSEHKPATVGGEEPAHLPLKLPMTDAEGNTRMVNRNMYVPKSLVKEIRGVLDTDLPAGGGALHLALAKATALQLVGFADAVSHLKNIHTVLANSLGRGTLLDIAERAVPGITTADTMVRVAGVIMESLNDTPRIRAEKNFLAKNGMLRNAHVDPAGPNAGFLKRAISRGWNFSSSAIHEFDTAARIVANRFYDNMIARGADPSLLARRKFVMQIGEYNSRLMNANTIAGKMKQIGLSPFVVAGKSFNRFSRRAAFGSSGMKFNTPGAALRARAINMLTIPTVIAWTAMINMATTGKAGGRPGTPVGAIDLGGEENPVSGKHATVDLLQIAGIRRGLRGTGVDAFLNAAPGASLTQDILPEAGRNIVQTWSHPYFGPGLETLATVGAGMVPGTLSFRGSGQEQPRKMEGAGDQMLENARVWLKENNKMLYGPLRSAFGDKEKSTWGDLGNDLLEPVKRAGGYTERQSPALAKAKQLAAASSKPMRPEQVERSRMTRELTEARFGPDGEPLSEDDAREAALQVLAQHGLNPDDAGDAMKRAGRRASVTPLEFYVANMDAKDAFEVWRLATTEERGVIRNMVIGKLARSKAMTLDELEKRYNSPGLVIDPRQKRNLDESIARRRARAR